MGRSPRGSRVVLEVRPAVVGTGGREVVVFSRGVDGSGIARVVRVVRGVDELLGRGVGRDVVGRGGTEVVEPADVGGAVVGEVGGGSVVEGVPGGAVDGGAVVGPAVVGGPVDDGVGLAEPVVGGAVVGPAVVGGEIRVLGVVVGGSGTSGGSVTGGELPVAACAMSTVTTAGVTQVNPPAMTPALPTCRRKVRLLSSKEWPFVIGPNHKSFPVTAK